LLGKHLIAPGCFEANGTGLLPKTRSGKILRCFLKAKELGTDVGDVSTMEG
jgi:acyl-CoA synthetase (AMP-forming)/AMP-acid ligase II